MEIWAKDSSKMVMVVPTTQVVSGDNQMLDILFTCKEKVSLFVIYTTVLLNSWVWTNRRFVFSSSSFDNSSGSKDYNINLLDVIVIIITTYTETCIVDSPHEWQKSAHLNDLHCGINLLLQRVFFFSISMHFC